MRWTLGKRGVRVSVWGVAAVLAALAVGVAFHIHADSALGQDQPSEQDLRAPDEADMPKSDDGESVEKPPPGQSRLKVPRFVSLRSGEVNVRTGPGTRYPVEWMFQRRGLPVEITAEFGTWRRIRDGQGGEGWVHRSMLSGKRTAIITPPVETLHRHASADSPAVAKAQQGVVANVQTCRDSWCEIDTQGFQGWVPETSLWGVYPNETIK